MKIIFVLLIILWCQSVTAQSAQSYKNSREETHLCGKVKITDLQTTPYQKWFDESFNEFDVENSSNKWKKNLKKTEVEIYFGTWCGDSKNWVPKFIKLWDELGLDRSQLKLIALYDGDEKYKQGPNKEEKGKNIHRVPTFIFKKENNEYARIVESPKTDLLTDLAQIALGYPSSPNYKAATYMMDLLNDNSKDQVYDDFKKHLNTAYRLVGKSSELNTLGYVFLRAGEYEKALTVFHFNTYYFPYKPNVYDSYAEALVIAGETQKAIENYNKVLELDDDNENAIKQIEKLSGD